MLTLENVLLEIHSGLEWVNISSAIGGDIEAGYGIENMSIKERISGIGYLKFLLLRRDNLETARGASSVDLDFLTKGLAVRLSLTYGGDTYIKFIGKIDKLQCKTTREKIRYIYVEAVDWMSNCVEAYVSKSVKTNQNGNTVIAECLEGLPTLAGMSLDATIENYPYIYDLSNNHTKVLSEFSKVVSSDLGYLLLRKPRKNGEELVYWNRNRINEVNRALPQMDGSYLMTDNAGGENFHILTEDNQRLLANDKFYEAIFENIAKETLYNYGSNYYSGVSLSLSPRKVDNTTVTLYSLPTYIQLNPGETKSSLILRYSDPTQTAEKVAGYDMITPVITTDYLMNATSDGSGLDISSNLTVEITFYSTYAEVTLTNTSAIIGYITQFNLRGKGIYTYSKISQRKSDTSLLDVYGERNLELDMPYQGDTNLVNLLTDKVFSICQSPQTDMENLEFFANESDFLMSAFLTLDIGDVIEVINTLDNFQKYMFLKYIKFILQKDGSILVNYKMMENLSLKDTYEAWVLGDAVKSVLDVSTILGG